MVFLGFGKYARTDRIYALEPLTGDERGGGRRTRVWVDGVPEPIVASRTERTILQDMGQEPAAAGARLLDEAISLAEKLAEEGEKVGPLAARSIKAETGLDIAELARRARRVLAATARADDQTPLF
jgi:hypothetical protein